MNALKFDFGGARRNRRRDVSHSTAATGATRGSETGNVVRSVVTNTRLNVKKFAYLAVRTPTKGRTYFPITTTISGYCWVSIDNDLSLTESKRKGICGEAGGFEIGSLF